MVGIPNTRAEAKSSGSAFYFTGKPCKNGHVCCRRVSSNCLECEAALSKKWSHQYYVANRERLLKINKEYAEANQERIKVWHRNYGREYVRKRRRDDPQWKIKGTLRSRLRYALKGRPKGVSSGMLLGCSGEQARIHIESLWSNGMNWANHGRGPGKWQIDHIRPFTRFDLQDPMQLATVCHYSNLQPLWFDDHVKKTARQVAGGTQ